MRVENYTQSGVPDVNYFHHATKKEGWIELKVGSIRMRPAQVAWHKKNLAVGRRVFVLTYDAKMYQLWKCLEVEPASKGKLTIINSLVTVFKEVDLGLITAYLTIG